jgi:hypothetical protein
MIHGLIIWSAISYAATYLSASVCTSASNEKCFHQEHTPDLPRNEHTIHTWRTVTVLERRGWPSMNFNTGNSLICLKLVCCTSAYSIPILSSSKCNWTLTFRHPTLTVGHVQY